MPELPEVEIVCRGLEPVMRGATLRKVVLNRPDLRFPFADGFAARLTGERIARVSRRAKYIVAETAGGLALAMHLGMTGRFTIAIPGEADAGERTPGSFYYNAGADPRHDHVLFELEDGNSIRYNDARRFGYMTLLETQTMSWHPLFSHLGVEPLSDGLTPGYLMERASGKSQSLKAFLLDQRVVAGLGNIYACEALFRARLDPWAEARTVGEGATGAQKRAGSLCSAIKAVLLEALDAGGSSFRDYRHTDGGKGGFQDKFDVYGRTGEACRNGCGETVHRSLQNSRSTFSCPACQSRMQ